MSSSVSFYSIHIEFVATGYGHLDRTPCAVYVVNEDGEYIVESIIHVSRRVDVSSEVSCVSIDSSQTSMLDVKYKLQEELCSPTSVIIGYNISRCIHALNLVQGRDFLRAIDIKTLFAYWSHRHQNWNYFHIKRIIYGILNTQELQSMHFALQIMHIFRTIHNGNRCEGEYINYRHTQVHLETLLNLLYTRGFHRMTPYKYKRRPSHVCYHAYRPHLCMCQQPTLHVQHQRVHHPPWYF